MLILIKCLNAHFEPVYAQNSYYAKSICWRKLFPFLHWTNCSWLWCNFPCIRKQILINYESHSSDYVTGELKSKYQPLLKSWLELFMISLWPQHGYRWSLLRVNTHVDVFYIYAFHLYVAFSFSSVVDVSSSVVMRDPICCVTGLYK